MSETHHDGWKLEELAQRAGVSARTIRYYVQRGLLPAPTFRGRDTVYTDDHLLRLQVIQRLQKQFLPLDRIQHELTTRSVRQLQELLQKDDESAVTQSRPVMLRSLAQSRQRTADEGDTKSERWLRWVLAPGLELHIAETVDPETFSLAEQLRTEFLRRQRKGDKR
jgi:DNA-binding transcriptional MerR regulator